MPLQPGTVLGPYEIIDGIGAGGMGEVYRARDTRLNRTVAIKILSDEGADEAARRRFQREAEAASALNHPHILAIHDTGDTAGRQFIVMELADGGTLREWLVAGRRRWPQVLEMLIGVADALGAAHAAGIVHRDIKPENILITQSGYAKLSDFGVAMLTAPVAEAMPTRTQATRPGALIGTFGYMAPEQLRGEPADGRTDIFSFGVLMYESLSGRRPFEAHTEPALAAAILTDAPPPLERIVPEVPPELSRIVAKTLEKDPARRYQSAMELAIDLRRLQQTSQAPTEVREARPASRARAAALVGSLLLAIAVLAGGAYYWIAGRNAAIQSVAVLPIANATGDPAVEYLSDGMTDSIIARLSEIPALKVMSHSAVFHYKGRDVDARTLGQELGVEALLIGRLMKRGDSFGFRLELVSARDASFIWGDQYDRPLAELPALQREIPLDIATKLRPRLGSAPLARLEKTHTDNPEAYQLYLKGRYSWEKWTTDGARQAVDFFERAIALDPSYALAYAGLSDAYLVGPGPGLTEQEARRRAREAATKALSLDPQLAEPHLALAGVLLFDAWDLAGADREYLRALELNPSCAECHHLYSHLLLILGRYPESLRESQKLLDLDPVSETPTGHLANHYLIARQFDAAIAQYKEDRRRFPDAARNEEFGDALYFGGRVGEAVDEYIASLSAGKAPDLIPALRTAYATGGVSAFFRQRLAQWNAVAPAEQNRMVIAAYQARLGESDLAVKTLEEGYAAHASWMVLLHCDPSFDSLRRDARYADLLRRVGLPQL